MTELQKTKTYDLEERTLALSKATRDYVNSIPKTIPNIENGRQLVRASGSIGANYIEANEALSKKDFVHRIKICRKEAKEARYWFNLTEPVNTDLAQEAGELMKIFGAILEKSK